MSDEGARLPRTGRRVVLGGLLAGLGLFALAPGSRNLLSARSTPGEDFRRGLRLHREGDYDEAARIFARLAGDFPKNPLPQVMLGMSHFNRGHFPEAVESFTRALPLSGNAAVVYLYRGEASLALGDIAQARADFEAALRSPGGDERIVTAARTNLSALEAGRGP